MTATTYGQAILSIIPVRAEAKHASEQVTQLLYNEPYTILEEQEEWVQIQCLHDNYEGWIPKNQVHYINKETFETPFQYYSNKAVYWDEELNRHIYMGTPFHKLPAISSLEKVDRVCQAAHKFINAPYVWGGRSMAGIDCSGFMQIVYRMGNILLPRDASQQIHIGTTVEWGQHKAGDMAFFTNEAGEIGHVGLLLDDSTIIHASAWVRIDSITQEGIFHENEQTHKLAKIQRVL